ncbi:MAG: ATP-binding protein [Ilumatobacteraceae bacterium]
MDLRQVPLDLTLPEASYAAWMAVFQNLLTNAFRATLDERPGRIAISGGKRARSAWLRVQNTGLAVDLEDAERLFLPFERVDSATERSEALGLGGSGLGLTIVRMIAQDVGCTVRFVEPEPGWSTSIELEWKVEQ